jgi:hypothetical protein
MVVLTVTVRSSVIDTLLNITPGAADICQADGAVVGVDTGTANLAAISPRLVTPNKGMVVVAVTRDVSGETPLKWFWGVSMWFVA